MGPCKYNLFDDNIKIYKTVFCIKNEKDIDEMWNYCNILMSSSEIKKNLITSIIRFLYNMPICDSKKGLNHSIKIYFEYSEKYFYVSFQDACLCKFIGIKKGLFNGISYGVFEDTISMRIEYGIETKSTVSNTLDVNKYTSSIEPIKPKIIYDFINQDTLVTMQEIIDETFAELILIEKRGFSEKSLTKLIYLGEDYINNISYYNEIRTVTNTLNELILIMSQNKNTIIEMKVQFVTFFNGITTSMQRWQEDIFVNGVDNLHFLDDSIHADVLMIKELLNLENSQSCESFETFELDDVFF